MKKEKVTIYDLDNSNFLYQDIENILDTISEMYDIKFGIKSNEYFSKTILSDKHHWVSDEGKRLFNKLVPKIKSLTKDMYSVIEGIYVSKYGKFNKPKLEKKYKNLKEFRIFNNKLKHHNNREANIALTSLSMLSEKGTRIDCSLQFRYLKTDDFNFIRFTNIIDTFFNILENEDIITIER